MLGREAWTFQGTTEVPFQILTQRRDVMDSTVLGQLRVGKKQRQGENWGQVTLVRKPEDAVGMAVMAAPGIQKEGRQSVKLCFSTLVPQMPLSESLGNCLKCECPGLTPDLLICGVLAHIYDKLPGDCYTHKKICDLITNGKEWKWDLTARLRQPCI